MTRELPRWEPATSDAFSNMLEAGLVEIRDDEVRLTSHGKAVAAMAGLLVSGRSRDCEAAETVDMAARYRKAVHPLHRDGMVMVMTHFCCFCQQGGLDLAPKLEDFYRAFIKAGPDALSEFVDNLRSALKEYFA